MAGHAAGDGMDRVQDLDAALLELGREVGDRALGLRDGHAVAGHDDDQARVGELDGDVGGARGARRPAAARARPARSPPPVPTPAKNTFAIERFMASAICLVRIEPEAPTSMPATISAVLSSAMPAAAADSPVNAFRVEITTGMSAPPIGTTASTPSAPADSRISQNSSSDSDPGRDHHRQRDRDQQQRRR